MVWILISHKGPSILPWISRKNRSVGLTRRRSTLMKSRNGILLVMSIFSWNSVSVYSQTAPYLSLPSHGISALSVQQRIHDHSELPKYTFTTSTILGVCVVYCSAASDSTKTGLLSEDGNTAGHSRPKLLRETDTVVDVTVSGNSTPAIQPGS
jgi:hypothetical protein